MRNAKSINTVNSEVSSMARSVSLFASCLYSSMEFFNALRIIGQSALDCRGGRQAYGLDFCLQSFFFLVL